MIIKSIAKQAHYQLYFLTNRYHLISTGPYAFLFYRCLRCSHCYSFSSSTSLSSYESFYGSVSCYQGKKSSMESWGRGQWQCALRVGNAFPEAIHERSTAAPRTTPRTSMWVNLREQTSDDSQAFSWDSTHWLDNLLTAHPSKIRLQRNKPIKSILSLPPLRTETVGSMSLNSIIVMIILKWSPILDSWTVSIDAMKSVSIFSSGWSPRL